MNLFGSLEISSSALRAERTRAEVVASNMANAETTRTPEGGPYKRKMVVFSSDRPTFASAIEGAGVKISQVVEDKSDPIRRFEPNHPDADAQGYVAYPDINPIEEMTDLMSATRAYELNASAVQATKTMLQQSLELLR
jgi:flagellar basal-body rod protein FlgC